MDVGRALHDARIARGLYIAEISQRTKLRSSLIEAIEAGDFEACGGDVFARGYVRAIATAIGIDPSPLVEAMGASSAASSLEPENPATVDIWKLERRSRVPSEWRVWGVLALAAVAIVGAFAWQSRNSGQGPALDASALPSVTTTATASVTPEATPMATPSSAASTTASTNGSPAATPPQETAPTVVQGKIVLTVTCTQTSWLRITNAVGTLFEGMLKAGERRSMSSDTSVTVRVGNGAGVTLTVNGTTYGNLGGPGEVVTRTFDVG